MVQEVYVDLYFLINSCMNLLTLMISATLLHRKVNPGRAWLASAAGGLWAVVALLWADTAAVSPVKSNITRKRQTSFFISALLSKFVKIF